MRHNLSWIKEFINGTYALFSGQVLEGFQPLDFYHFFPQWYDRFINYLWHGFNNLAITPHNVHQFKDMFPTPSNVRSVITKAVISYYAMPSNLKQNMLFKQRVRFVCDVLVSFLNSVCKEDPFSIKFNRVHSNSEVKELLRNNKWVDVSLEDAKMIGRLITSAGSLVHALYNDVVTDYGWEVYGPYDLNNGSLLIRYFPDLRPLELWDEAFLPNINNMKIFSIYDNSISWKISYVGCHTISFGSKTPPEAMLKSCVLVEDNYIEFNKLDELVQSLSYFAQQLYSRLMSMSETELKKVVIKQEFYQFNRLFRTAGMPLFPDEEIIEEMSSMPLVKQFLPYGKFMKSPSEFLEEFHINEFFYDIYGVRL